MFLLVSNTNTAHSPNSVHLEIFGFTQLDCSFDIQRNECWKEIRSIFNEPKDRFLCLSSFIKKLLWQILRYTIISSKIVINMDWNKKQWSKTYCKTFQYISCPTLLRFYPIKITSTWNALPSEVVSSRTVNSFKKRLDKHWVENPQMSVWTGSNYRFRTHFKCAQTVVGNGPNGLSNCYYYYWKYFQKLHFYCSRRI